ncbi:MAG: DMT family transporter, partial [Chitinophagaceae bacterium]
KEITGTNFSAQYLKGNLLIFSGVAGSAFYNTYCKKIVGEYTEMEMLFYTYIFMILLLLPLVWTYEGNVFMNISAFTSGTWIGLLLLTLFHNFLSMILFFMALKKLEAIQVALSNFLITFFAVPIAMIWLNEKVGFWAIWGGVLVLTSTLAITIVEYRRSSAVAGKQSGVNAGASNF